jgi:hypothetical protein
MKMTRNWLIGGALILGIIGLFEDGFQGLFFGTVIGGFVGVQIRRWIFRNFGE